MKHFADLSAVRVEARRYSSSNDDFRSCVSYLLRDRREQRWRDVREKLWSVDMAYAWNVGFDRTHVCDDDFGFDRQDLHCAMAEFRRLHPGEPWSLDAASRFYDIWPDQEVRHTALYDAGLPPWSGARCTAFE